VAYSPPTGQSPYYGPHGQPYPPYQPPYWGHQPRPQPTNVLAVIAFVCGLTQFVVVLTFIPAVVCGHVARAQIRRTGEAGGGLALAGLVLGYVGGAIVIGLTGLLIAIAVNSGHGSAVHEIPMPFVRAAPAAPTGRALVPVARPIVVMPYVKANSAPASAAG
jgi:Domain of unknown function (DUF4190)